MELIVVIQNEPRDGDIVYLEKDMEAFKTRVCELAMETIFGEIELGQLYYDEDNFSTIVGYEVKLPFVVNRWCRGCWYGLDDGYSPDIGDTVYFECVAEADCDTCKIEDWQKEG
jgi:hypothetical protein